MACSGVARVPSRPAQVNPMQTHDAPTMQPEAADGRPRYPEFLARLQSIAAERLRQNERILAEEALEVCRRRHRRHARERSVIVRARVR